MQSLPAGMQAYVGICHLETCRSYHTAEVLLAMPFQCGTALIKSACLHTNHSHKYGLGGGGTSTAAMLPYELSKGTISCYAQCMLGSLSKHTLSSKLLPSRKKFIKLLDTDSLVIRSFKSDRTSSPTQDSRKPKHAACKDPS